MLKDYWTVFECSYGICGHEFNVKTRPLGCEFSCSLVQGHDHRCLVERELGVTVWENWQSECAGEKVRQGRKGCLQSMMSSGI